MLLRSPDRKPGLADITRKSSRIKDFRLEDGILYSYWRDPRFVSAVCAIIGFAAWWGLAPEPLLQKPEALCAPDLKLVVQVVKERHLRKPHMYLSPREQSMRMRRSEARSVRSALKENTELCNSFP